MTNFYRHRKGIFFWLCIIYYLNAGIDAHHNDTCTSSDDRPALCVSNRYCRERFKHHLLPCGNNKICCPIPTPSTSTTPSVTPKTEPPRRPSDSERPQQSDRYSPSQEDGPMRKPVSSYDKPVKEFPPARLDENERPRYVPEVYDTQDGDSRSKPARDNPLRTPVEKGVPRYNSDDYPSSLEDDRRSRRPVISYEKPVDETPNRRPESGIPRQRVDTDRSPSIEDERSRRPINSYDKPEEEIPRRRIPPPEERRRPMYDADDRLPSLSDDERSRRPIIPYDRPVEREKPRDYVGNSPSMTGDRTRRPTNTYSKPADDIPPRRPVNDGRPRQNKPTYDYSPMDDEEDSRKPIVAYDEPVNETPSRVRGDNVRPVGRPRYDDRLERPLTKPGKVRFEDEPFREEEERPPKQFERGRPSGNEPIEIDDDYDKRPENFPMPRREATTYNKRRDGDEELTRPDDYNRRPQNGAIPSHYPSKDQIEVHRDPPRSSNPVLSRNQSTEVSKSTHEFPGPFSVSQVPECGVKPYELFIAGGEASEPHEWPWMTAIFRRHQNSRPKTFLCGGALINTKYVLTAAHCFVHNYVILPASSFVVRLGSHQLSSGEEYTVSDLVVHHNHSGSDFFNDIALVKLAGQVFVTDKVAPICLPPRQDMAGDDFVGRMGTVAGWGDTVFRTGGSRTLQHVTIPIVSSEECLSAYSRVRGAAFLAKGSDHVICAGLREGGKDACLGDSGGPLMLKTSEDRWIVIGIVSLGYKCAEPGYPGVYTRVTHYIPWIQNNMRRH